MSDRGRELNLPSASSFPNSQMGQEEARSLAFYVGPSRMGNEAPGSCLTRFVKKEYIWKHDGAVIKAGQCGHTISGKSSRCVELSSILCFLAVVGILHGPVKTLGLGPTQCKLPGSGVGTRLGFSRPQAEQHLWISEGVS